MGKTSLNDGKANLRGSSGRLLGGGCVKKLSEEWKKSLGWIVSLMEGPVKKK